MNGRTGWLRLVAGALAVPNIGAPARAVLDAPAVTVWKGFQPSRHAGMTFEARSAQ